MLSTKHIVVLLVLAFITWRFLNLAWLFKPRRDKHELRSVAILVLGDIGRSPRMMYHAESFAENDFLTHVIGYGGSNPIPSLERLPRVDLRYLPEPLHILRSVPFVIAAPFKIIFQVVSIMSELLVRMPTPPEFIVVQNPPSIPTLALVWIVSMIRGCKVIIDWHNLGYSILALKVGPTHPFVRIAKWFEATFGRSAYAHLFVTQAMRDFLVKEWDLQGLKIVLHDRPPRHFHRSTPQEIHDLFCKLDSQQILNAPVLDGFLPTYQTPYSTPFTDTTSSGSAAPPSQSGNKPIPTREEMYTEIHPPSLRPDRPAVVVSSTSWTPDEDFGILLDAMSRYEESARAREDLPKMLVVVTGKGPQRAEYMNRINGMQKEWTKVRCVSMWLKAEDYPTLLGSADVGVSLHWSSSGLDLPMKVVDMLGCEVPVCALGFDCLHELLQDGKNGLVFHDADQLSEQLQSLLTGFPSSPQLDALRSAVHRATEIQREHSSPRQYIDVHEHGETAWGTWDENWARLIRPIILNDVQRDH